jgi:hypothetical protein
MTHWLFFIVIDGVKSDESVSLYPSRCGGEEAKIEGNVYERTAVPIQINRICKHFLSPTVNTTGVTHNKYKNKFTHHLRSKRLLSDKLMLLFQTEIQRGNPEQPSS